MKRLLAVPHAIQPFCRLQRFGRSLCACAANHGDIHSSDNKWKGNSTSSRWAKQPRHSSTPVTPDDAIAEKMVDKEAWKEKLRTSQGSQVIFPWRHEEKPLDRLVDKNSNVQAAGVLGPGFFNPVPWFLKHIFTQVSAVHLNVPWYSVFIDSQWKQELADASGFAFSQAVAGVLSNTYEVPFHEITSGDGAIEFSISIDEDDVGETGQEVDKDEEGEEEGDKTENGKGTHDDTNIDYDEDATPEVKCMIEDKLRKLYEASHEFGKDQMHVRLEMIPIHCNLMSLLFIPYITRQAIKEAPSLKHVFRNMFRDLQGKRIDENGEPASIIQLTREAFRIGEEYAKSRVLYKQGEDFIMLESTVVAQVLVTCDEVFSVSDVTSGILIQGDGQTRRVHHLVRLEVVVQEKIPKGGGKPEFHVGSWQIVDWDDLVDGNLWCY